TWNVAINKFASDFEALFAKADYQRIYLSLIASLAYRTLPGTMDFAGIRLRLTQADAHGGFTSAKELLDEINR
ncbi:hypothetical protein HK405_004781, partial [Cladochytrium tenue]